MSCTLFFKPHFCLYEGQPLVGSQVKKKKWRITRICLLIVFCTQSYLRYSELDLTTSWLSGSTNHYHLPNWPSMFMLVYAVSGVSDNGWSCIMYQPVAA